MLKETPKVQKFSHNTTIHGTSLKIDIEKYEDISLFGFLQYVFVSFSMPA